MANRAIYAIIGAGCFKIINTPELNLYCGNQLQPGGEGSIMYIDDNLRNIITDDAQFLQVAIAAQKGFDNGWTFKEMGIGEDGLPALEMVPPVIIDGIQYDYSNI